MKLARGSVGARMGAQLEARPGIDLGRVGFGNIWTFECYDKSGVLKWQETVKNVVTTEGMTDLLTEYFGGTAVANWYIGLTKSHGGTGPAVGDTAAQIGGTNDWTESQDYTEANRGTITLGAASGTTTVSRSNGTTVDFTMNATVTIQGAFLISNNTKGGATGVLFAVAALTGGDRSVVNTDVLKVTATVSVTNS